MGMTKHGCPFNQISLGHPGGEVSDCLRQINHFGPNDSLGSLFERCLRATRTDGEPEPVPLLVGTGVVCDVAGQEGRTRHDPLETGFLHQFPTGGDFRELAVLNDSAGYFYLDVEPEFGLCPIVRPGWSSRNMGITLSSDEALIRAS